MPSDHSSEIAIKVWRFWKAPAEFQALSDNGGDEDWVALVPRKVWDDEGGFIPWALDGEPFGVCEVLEFALPDGDIVLIGVHA